MQYQRAPQGQRTFRSFLEGSENLFALRACQRFSLRWSPLILVGPSGSGKSHLLGAVARELHTKHDRVIAIPAERFLNDFTSSLRRDESGRNTMPEFRQTYRRSVDALVIDNFDVLCGDKGTTQEELLSTLATLMHQDVPIVLASSKPLQHLDWLVPDLPATLLGGLTVDLKAPSLKLRARALTRWAYMANEELAPEVAIFIAGHASDMGALRGCWNRVHAHTKLLRAPLTIEAVSQAMTDYLPAGASELDYQSILTGVAKRLLSDRCPLRISKSRARHAAMWVLKEINPKLSDAEVQRQVGLKQGAMDYARSKINARRERDRKFAELLDQFVNEFSGTWTKVRAIEQVQPLITGGQVDAEVASIRDYLAATAAERVSRRQPSAVVVKSDTTLTDFLAAAQRSTSQGNTKQQWSTSSRTTSPASRKRLLS